MQGEILCRAHLTTMRAIVELLAFGKPGETREVEVPGFWDKWALAAQVADEFDEEEPRDEWILSQVFKYGQNEVQPQDHPSVSAGDVIHIGEDKWLVRAVGFQKLLPEQYAEYKSMIPEDRMAASFLPYP